MKAVARARLLVITITGATLASLSSSVQAGAPYRAWHRGQIPPNSDGNVEEIRLPNGALVLVKTGRTGNRYFVGEVLPGALNLGSLMGFPNEKNYRELLLKERYDQAGELLEKILADPTHGSELVAPSWAPWELPAWTSVNTLARARLLSLPLAAREAVRRIRDEEANPRLEAAAALGDPYELRRLLARYPVATGAPAAAVTAGDLSFESGDFTAALIMWERARRDYEGDVDDAALATRIERARILLRARTRPERPLRPRPAAAVALGEVALTQRPPMRLLWRRRVVVTPPAIAMALPGLLARGEGDTAFIQDDAGVSALEVETGRLLWQTPLERVGLFPGDDAPSTVTVGDQLALVRGRRLVYVLDRETGRVRTRLHAGRDMGAGADDHLDAAICVPDGLVVLASIGTERIAFGFERSGALQWRTPLWASGGLDASIVACGEGSFVACDGGVALIDLTGAIRWVAPATEARVSQAWRAPARSPERGLELRGDLLLRLDLSGILGLDPATGIATPQPEIAPDSLVVGVADSGPVILETLPRTPNDSRPRLLAPGGPAGLVPVRRLEFEDRPAFPGAVADGVLYLTRDEDPRAPASDPRHSPQLFGIDLGTGREVDRVFLPGGPGRVSTVGDVVLVSRDDEVLAFASRSFGNVPAVLPDSPDQLAALLGAADWRLRLQARARLQCLGTTALPVLRSLALGSASSLEARSAARELIQAALERDAWASAFPTLPAEHLERLNSRRPDVRIRALLALPLPSQPDAAAAEALAHVFRRAAVHDREPAMRAEALGRLLRYDSSARDAVFRVLALEPPGAMPPDLELARSAAATAIAASGCARPGAPGNDALEQLLATGSETARMLLYRALLRHGGQFEGGVVARCARPAPDPKTPGHDVPADPVADRVLKAWSQREEHDDPGALDDESLEASQRRALLDEERRALLARPELAKPLAEPDESPR